MVLRIGALCIMAGVVTAAFAGPAAAQPRSGSRGPLLRVEPDTRGTRPASVTGWVYNDGDDVAGLVRMKVEMLDESGKAVAEHIGWAYGNVSPGGRAFFMIPLPPGAPAQRRVTVESYVLQSYTIRSESP